jgi:hypothetical protein
MRNHPDAEVLVSVLGLDGPGRPARGDFGDFLGNDLREPEQAVAPQTLIASGFASGVVRLW